MPCRNDWVISTRCNVVRWGKTASRNLPRTIVRAPRTSIFFVLAAMSSTTCPSTLSVLFNFQTRSECLPVRRASIRRNMVFLALMTGVVFGFSVGQRGVRTFGTGTEGCGLLCRPVARRGCLKIAPFVSLGGLRLPNGLRSGPLHGWRGRRPNRLRVSPPYRGRARRPA